ncbi:uncharacterized protein TrAFT101_003268 [Trichoderma asperellum]|uniref:Uncharacterized protein n=1 Tax=Trichoderma asperellum (strain ATCC 204424 / CBS 433.97 / NBRC 101777) TaxID=1042311 RepID=A0A2T3ZIT7_TRIA4|nr:hypothetical protein M441DRAFT_354526 [Trichoderma asperellum CBS 433.97]PTB44724.1 hypothetical protein M441DRAFT_354526 [Trichoderma asperellum CBS 433.97]UKZ87472.1 hypothetical protein TrAFT101_003268 [Trichoderma asperellum]
MSGPLGVYVFLFRWPVGTWGFVCSTKICYTRVKKKGRAGSRPLKTIDPLTVERAGGSKALNSVFLPFFDVFVCLFVAPSGGVQQWIFWWMVRTGWLDERNT